MERLLEFSDEHILLRDNVRKFLERECVPHYPAWERAGVVPREIWRRAGELGFLCPMLDPELGGSGLDYLASVVIQEEVTGLVLDGLGFTLHSDIVVPYLQSFATPEQQRRWLPRMASGELIGALAITEPTAGSDVAGIRTRAERRSDRFVVNGSKVFISNGQLADLVVLAVRTGTTGTHRDLSLLVVETDQLKGFRRGRNLEKLGAHAQDTSELFFEDMEVPAKNLLGEDGGGFKMMMHHLAQERLVMAVRSIAASETALRLTTEYVRDRRAFGKTIFDFQNTRFELADLYTALATHRVFVDRCIQLHCAGRLDAAEAAMAKYATSEMQFRLMDRCLQLFGGWGYMTEYPIARLWAESRVFRIAGGTSEIMKEVIARSIQ
jgi:alkylation response protein AidB-like acyl-CoA dehydrogenase